MSAPTTTSQSAPALELRGVSVNSLRHPGSAVLQDINWTVGVGDFWVVGGLQGSGKSDFLFTVGGLNPQLAGTCTCLGEPMPIFEEERLPQRLRLGLVFDGGRLLTRLTVRENIALPLRYHHNLRPAEADPEVNALLEALGLTDWAETSPGALGLSWQQRVGLARALILRPEILLVDDPLTALDLRHADWWLGFLTQLSAGHPALDNRPVTLVVTAADLRPWRGRARQFAVLRDQRLAVLGSWDQVEDASAELLAELISLPHDTT